jgi:hypothetical protein
MPAFAGMTIRIEKAVVEEVSKQNRESEEV